MKILTPQELEDILYGCTILGTGGGGDLNKGLKLIEKDLASGREFKLIGFDELDEGEWVVCPYMCGAVTEEEQFSDELEQPSIVTAVNALEKYLKKSFKAAVASEMGGMNTAVALSAAANLNLPIVDADAAGRAVPELQHSTYYINNVSIAPMGLATEFGDVAVLEKVRDDFRAEALVRAMAAASKNSIAVADHPGPWSYIKKALVPNTISYAAHLGRIRREALHAGKDAVAQICNAGGGKILFKGIIKKHDWEIREGFTYGEIFIEGMAEDTGHEYHIWYQNENIVAKKDGKFHVTIPDLITLLDENAAPVTNPGGKPGMKVTVIGLPAPDMWTTPKGIETFGPRYFRFDTDYVSISSAR
ncbi:MAG: DUF917 domain-containing protein [Tepidanaerobacteraceae bacterium]|nr:DUF917 domain-containing protein [Tepidanaerobacteraceae bacterium]